MAKICSNCGNTNEDHQNFCTNCGTPLAQQAPPPPPEMASEFVPVIDPQPVAPPPPANDWQAPPPPTPPAAEWQAPPTPPIPPAGEWQAPPPPVPPAGAWQDPQTPPPGQYQQPFQAAPPPQAPIFNSQQAKADFAKSKGLFMDMINAHKADAEPSSQTGEIPPRRYPALKLFMTIYRVIAWIWAGSILLAGLIAFFARTFTRYWYQGLLALPVAILLAFLALASVYAMLDVVRLFINIEDNTRRSANK